MWPFVAKKMNLLFYFENRLCNHLRQPISSLFIRNTKFVDVVSPHERSFTSRVLVSPGKSTAFEPIVARGVFASKKVSLSVAIRAVYKSVFDVDTNVKKDVLLYVNDSAYYYLLNYFVVVAFVTWTSIAYFFKVAVRVVPDEHLKLFQYLDISQKKWQIIITTSFAFAGNLLFRILRNLMVKKVILFRRYGSGNRWSENIIRPRSAVLSVVIAQPSFMTLTERR